MNRTHLRFFTRTTKDSLFPSDLFEMDANLVNLSPLHLGRKYGCNMDRLVEDAAIYQFIMRVIKK